MFSAKLRLRVAEIITLRKFVSRSIFFIVLITSLPYSETIDVIADSLFTRKNYWLIWHDSTVIHYPDQAGYTVIINKPGKNEYQGAVQGYISVLKKEKTYKITLIASSDSSCVLPVGFKGKDKPYLNYAIRTLKFKPELDTFNLTWVNSGANSISPSSVIICVMIGNARGTLRFKKLSITEQDASPSDTNDFECPVIPKLNPPVRPSSELPNGLLAYSYSQAGTIVLSPINKWSPVKIPGIDATPNNIFFYDDGKWLLYRVESEMFVIRIDGKYKTKVPVSDTISACNFYWKSPYGVEIAYSLQIGNTLKSIPVIFSDTGVSFGSSRTIANLGSNFKFEEFYQISVVKDQIWGAICPIVNYQSQPVKRSGFMTIPDSGKGIATPANLYKFSDNNEEEVFGCSHTMSFDGNYCVANPGHAAETGDFSHCAPFQHKGFYVSRFYRDHDTAVSTREHVHRYSYSLNWCPDQYMHWIWNDVDFNLYNFTNNNKFLVAAQCGLPSTRKGLWAIDWESNYWYPLNPDSTEITAGAVAGFIGPYDQSILDSLAKNVVEFIDTTIKNPIGYKVIQPAGNEVFYPGQRCTIQVYSKKEGNAELIVKYGSKVTERIGIDAINPKIDSVIIIDVNDIIEVLSGQVKSDTAACEICLDHYVKGICDPICSNPFSIVFKSSINPQVYNSSKRLSTIVKTVDSRGIASILKTKEVYSFMLYDLLGRPVFSWERTSGILNPQSLQHSLKFTNSIYIARYTFNAGKNKR